MYVCIYAINKDNKCMPNVINVPNIMSKIQYPPKENITSLSNMKANSTQPLSLYVTIEGISSNGFR